MASADTRSFLGQPLDSAQAAFNIESQSLVEKTTKSGKRGRSGDGGGTADGSHAPARASCRKRTVSPGSTHLVDVRGRYRSVWSDRRDDGVGASKSARPRHPRKGTENGGANNTRGSDPAGGALGTGCGTRRGRSRTCEPLILLILSGHVDRGHPRGDASGRYAPPRSATLCAAGSCEPLQCDAHCMTADF